MQTEIFFLKVQTVNFFMPVEIPTGHPDHILELAFLGRAIIEPEHADEFTADGITASIQDLFFLHDTCLPTETAMRIELPDPKTPEGRMFRSRLETAAKEAYWAGNDGVESFFCLPDEIDAGSPSFSEKLAARTKEIAAVGLTADELSKFRAI